MQGVCAGLPDEFKLSSSVCRHANIADVYDVDIVSSLPTLGMEKVETPLSSLLVDVGDMVTVRERVDLAFGIVCAVDYFHDHLRVAHGFDKRRYRVRHAAVECQTAIDPSAAFVLTGKMADLRHTAEYRSCRRGRQLLCQN